MIHQGVIYFVGFDHYVKIGYTTNLTARIKALQTSCPVRLKLYCSFHGTESEKRHLHIQFDKHRLLCEWFEFSEEIHEWLIDKDAELHGPPGEDFTTPYPGLRPDSHPHLGTQKENMQNAAEACRG